AAPVVGDAVAVARLHVAVDAVVGDVQLAADEPLGERRVRPVEHLVPLLVPVQRLGALGPEPLVVLVRALVDRGVRDDRVLGEVLGRRERLLVEELLQLLLERLTFRRHAFSSASGWPGPQGLPRATTIRQLRAFLALAPRARARGRP